MARGQATTTCEQAGQWISLRLDGELSEFDQARLDRHLDRCAGCSAFAAELTGIAQLLRSAPLVAFEPEPEFEPVRAPAVSRRRLVPVRARRAAYAAVASAAAAVVAFILLGSSESMHPSRNALEFRSAAEKAQFLRVQQRRIEPRVEPEVVTAPRMNPRGLL